MKKTVEEARAEIRAEIVALDAARRKAILNLDIKSARDAQFSYDKAVRALRRLEAKEARA